jgi:23S rRNA A1618 N6-methylase RlmF
MCNPPFYGNLEEVQHSAEAKEYGPNAVCTGADNEMITQGGEVAFVGRMVKESQTWKTRCR